MAYVRFVKERKIIQDMLFVKTLIANTKDESIFSTVKYHFKEKNIPLVKIISIITDGAPEMVCRHCGFIIFL